MSQRGHETQSGRLERLCEVAAHGLEVLDVSISPEALEEHPEEKVRALHALFVLAESNAGALLQLSRADRYLPAGWGCARGAVLAACRSMWLGDTDPPHDEARLISLIRETARRAEALAVLSPDGVREPFMAAHRELNAVADARAKMLGEEVKVPGIPSDEVLTSSVSDELHSLYIMASQFAHGTLMVTALTGSSPSEDRLPRDASWAILINLAWKSARNAAAVLLNVADLPVDVRLDQVDEAFEAALEPFRTG